MPPPQQNAYVASNLNNIYNSCVTGQRAGFGFTLAEVLITLGIIGVVAALTMPSLIQKHKEMETVIKLKKAYSAISQAYTTILFEDNINTVQYEYDSLIMMEKFNKHLKFQKVCGYDRGCFPDVTYEQVQGGAYVNWERDNKDRTRAIMNDGTLIMFNHNTNYIFAQIYVDINGFKGPNQLGKDFFYIYLTPDGKITPGGAPSLDGLVGRNVFKENCIKNGGYGCAAWVIYNENMDYLHCDDLDWNTKTKCK